MTTTALFLASAGMARGDAPAQLELRGRALGTTYSVKVAFPPPGVSRDELGRAIQDVLARVDRQMSTYRSDSELERFNQSRSTSWFAVSTDTVWVARAALDVAERSAGAFDPTVGPLVQLWGFGRRKPDPLPPSPEEVATLRAASGFENVEVRRAPPALRKRRPALELDFSSIAKGFAVDEVAWRLALLGAENVLVEVGGELRAVGHSTRGGPWIVAIEDPLPDGDAEPLRVSLENYAIATSGPYRNFRVDAGRRLSHVLDPRTGAPVDSDLIAVSVLAPTAMQADAWSTALLVAGPDAGWALARREGLAALFVQTKDGRTQRRANARFRDRQSQLPATLAERKEK